MGRKGLAKHKGLAKGKGLAKSYVATWEGAVEARAVDLCEYQGLRADGAVSGYGLLEGSKAAVTGHTHTKAHLQ